MWLPAARRPPPKPTWPDNGLIAVDRYWTGTAGVLAD
jgi:hypothetical protein